jgi:Cu+-exporting ATPase
MACCVFTAYIMNRLIAALETLDLNIITVQYNDFGNGSSKAILDKQDPVLVSSRLQISGMTCGACVGTIEKAVAGSTGVERVTVSLPLDRATVMYDKSQTSLEHCVAWIEEAEYGAKSGERTMEETIELMVHKGELKRLRDSFNGGIILSSTIATCGPITTWAWPSGSESQAGELFHLCSMLLTCWMQVYYAFWIHKNAWNKGRKGIFTMDTLISLSLLLGICLSFFNLMLWGFNGG